MTAEKQVQDKPTSRMAAEDRRHQILDVAIRLFSQKGFRGTTTREIAQAAGVNEAIIFRHFATKSELYSAIIDLKACSDSMTRMDKAVEQAIEARDDRKVFETIAINILEVHRTDETFLRLLFYSALEGHELADMFFRNQVSAKHRRTAEFISLRIKEGAFRKVDPLLTVRAYIGMVLHHAMSDRFFKDSLKEVNIDGSDEEIAKKFADLILTAVINPAQPAKKK